MEATGSFKIRFEDLTAADGNRAAAELQSMIEDSGIDADERRLAELLTGACRS